MEQSLRLVQLTSLNIRSTRRYYYVLRRVVFLRSQTAGMHLSTCPKVLRTQNHDVTKKAHRPTGPPAHQTWRPCNVRFQHTSVRTASTSFKCPLLPSVGIALTCTGKTGTAETPLLFRPGIREHLSPDERRRAIVLISRDFANIRPAWPSAAPTSTPTNFWSCNPQSDSPLTSSHFAF
jgi:hypothetical protein